MDRSLRDAERSGDGVALLREKIRAGQLTQAHVELAASLGHPDARELCPDVELVDWDFYKAGAEVRQAAELLGETFPARIAADWAERVLPLWTDSLPRWNEFLRSDGRPQEAVAAARVWANCPCKLHGDAARAAFEAARISREAANAVYVEEVDSHSHEKRWSSAVAAWAARAAFLSAWTANQSAVGQAAEDAPEVAVNLANSAVHTAADAGYCAAVAVLIGAEARRADASQTDACPVERQWQRLRLAAYVLGEVEEAARDR